MTWCAVTWLKTSILSGVGCERNAAISAAPARPMTIIPNHIRTMRMTEFMSHGPLAKWHHGNWVSQNLHHRTHVTLYKKIKKNWGNWRNEWFHFCTKPCGPELSTKYTKSWHYFFIANIFSGDHGSSVITWSNVIVLARSYFAVRWTNACSSLLTFGLMGLFNGYYECLHSFP